MGNLEMEQELESKRLEVTTSAAGKQLEALLGKRKEARDAILSSKKEMSDNTIHSVSNLWNAENFYDLIELSQDANSVSEQIVDYEEQELKVRTLERMLNAPYFARVNFKFDDEEEYEEIYIGQSSLKKEDSHEMLVYDWRSPISSVFYRFEKGPVFYEAPAGKISGEVNLKRQYEINQGHLDYFFDADIQITDDFLRRMLSQNTSTKMKTIVETIQKDQDLIIRDTKSDLMMIQGVAGSGKTSVALHRVAYLMFNGLASPLEPNNIIVISPNAVFESYISDVLPELGEKNVNTVLFEEILGKILKIPHLQSKNQFLEQLLSSEYEKRAVMKSAMEFKGSTQFVEILDKYIEEIPRKWLSFSDIYYDGVFLTDRQYVKGKVLKSMKADPLGISLKKLERLLLEKVRDRRSSRLKKLEASYLKLTEYLPEAMELARKYIIHEEKKVKKQIRKFTEPDFQELYQKLFEDKAYFKRLAGELPLPEAIDEILDATNKRLKMGSDAAYEDALGMAYLKLKIKAHPSNVGIKQVVIDEAQDYAPMHFELLDILFHQSRYTVLGDINQTIGKQADLSLYEEFSKILKKKHAALITMDKSFRCTNQILTYSSNFISKESDIKSFNREGEKPQVIKALDVAQLDHLLLSEIETCRDKNLKTIAIITKTAAQAQMLYTRLKEKTKIQLIKDAEEADLNGVTVLPIYISKGLEFDAVFICDVDNENYVVEDDKKLLYVACTRALHRLMLFYMGDKSPFVPD